MQSLTLTLTQEGKVVSMEANRESFFASKKFLFKVAVKA